MTFSDWLNSDDTGAQVCRMLLDRYPSLRLDMEKLYAVGEIQISREQLALQLEAGHA